MNYGLLPRFNDRLTLLYSDFTDVTKKLDARWTFTRTSDANRFNDSGLLVNVASGVPRVHEDQDYDPVTLEPLGFYCEDQATNAALWCRDFTNPVWVATNITPVKNVTGLDGVVNSACTLTATADGGTILQSVTSASTSRTSSCYVRRKTGNGTIEMTQNGGATWTVINPTTGPLKGQRFQAATATVANPQFGFRMGTSGDEIEVDVFQCEASAGPTSPIITTTASKARNADDLVIVGTPYTAMMTGVTDITMFAEARKSNSLATATVCSFGDGTSSNYMRLLFNYLGAITVDVRASGVNTMSSNLLATGYAGDFIKVALRVSPNYGQGAYNGTAGGVDTSTGIPAGLTSFRVGRSAASSTLRLNDRIKRVALYRSGLPETLLNSMTG